MYGVFYSSDEIQFSSFAELKFAMLEMVENGSLFHQFFFC